ncbi:agmatinase [Candidatus Kapabacteria bacterium]|nr:agmatinase [Candidatus Kapabacteria bacterium]
MVNDIDNNFLGLEEEFSNYDDSKVVIISAPYEHTVSYGGGTKNGPIEILNASKFVEFYDEEFDNELCFNLKIATLPSLDFSKAKDELAIELIRAEVSKHLENDKFVVTLGGEHTISSAPIKSHLELYPNLSVLQFDAHSDLRDTYEGSKWSHASVMSRVSEFLNPSKITQVGIRAQCKEEREFIKSNKINTFYANEIKRGIHSENWQKSVVDTLDEEIYVTFDVDYFDPSIMPATGTPEPDGFLYHQTLEVFREIKRQGKRIVGFDVVELAPLENLSHPNILTASLIYKLLNFSF